MGQLVIFIGKLVWHKVFAGMAAAQFMGFPDGPVRALGSLRKHYPCSKSLNHFAAFNRNRPTHDYFNRISSYGAYHRQSNPGITRGGFDYCFSLRESTAFFRLLYHFYGNTILDAPRWVKSLQLCVQRDVRLGV